MDNKLLEVKDLNISFNEKQVIKGLNFYINKGEVYSLVGRSGCGKTITSLSLVNLLSGSSQIRGSLFLNIDGDKLDLNQPENFLKARGRYISYIFQDAKACLNPLIRVGDQISEIFKFHRGLSKKEAFSKCLGLLEKVSLEDTERIYFSFPHQLSGGQAQRVMIAQALALDPVLLVADEPTSNLDVTVEMEIVKLLKTLKENFNLSILFITHDLTLVEVLSDRVGVIDQGIVEDEFLAKDIFTRKHKLITEQLKDACVRL